MEKIIAPQKVFTLPQTKIKAVAITPDGKYALSGSNDGLIRLWELASGECVRVFTNQAEPILERISSPWLGEVVPEKNLPGHQGAVLALNITPDGIFAVSGGEDATLRLWHLASGYCLKVYPGHQESIRALALSPRPGILATASNDCSLRLWDLRTAQCLQHFAAHPRASDIQGIISASNAEFSFNNCVMDYDQDRTYDDQNGKFYGHAAPVHSVVMARNSRYLLSGSEDKTVRLWDIQTGQCVWIFGGYRGGHPFGVNALALSPHKHYALTLGETLRYWRISSKHIRRFFWGIWDEHGWQVSARQRLNGQRMKVSPDGKWLVIADAFQRVIRVHRYGSKQCEKILAGHEGWINDLAVSPDSHYVVSVSDDGTLRLWLIE